jgi:hypothetical protein
MSLSAAFPPIPGLHAINAVPLSSSPGGQAYYGGSNIAKHSLDREGLMGDK